MSLEFPTRSDPNLAVQPQKMARGLKFTAVEENDGLDTHNTQELLNTDSSSSLQTAIGSASPPAKLELNS